MTKEQAIASDLILLENTIQRLHSRVEMYSMFGKPSKQVDEMMKAREIVFNIMRETKLLTTQRAITTDV